MNEYTPNKKNDIRKVFPYISYEELESSDGTSFYEKVFVSVFQKQLNKVEANKFITPLVRKGGKGKGDKLNEKFAQLYVKLYEKSECFVVSVLEYDEKGNEQIELVNIENDEDLYKLTMSSLKKENDLKLIFPDLNLMIEGGFDFTNIFYFVKNKIKSDVLPLLPDYDLHII